MRDADGDPLLPALVLDRNGHASHLPISRTIRGLVMESGQAVAFMDTDESVDASESLQAADIRAGMCAPIQSRGNYQFFTEETNEELSERIYLESQLRGSVARGELLELFQPVFDIRSGAMVSVEALLHWRHPERGLIRPDDFIRLAEETGLILSIGEWAIRKAFATMHESGMHHKLRLAVNLAARQLANADVVSTVSEALNAFDIPAEQVILEITETALPQANQALPNLKRLKDLGVRVAVDDFGTGYSSLSYLKELPVDILKLDRTFVSAIPTKEHNSEIASAVIAMAHKLKIEVAAEGVENAAQLKFLRENGCDFAQGFYLGEPMPFDQVICLISQHADNQETPE